MAWHYIKRTIAMCMLLLLIGAGAGLIYLQTQGGELLSVQSGSMEPSLQKGDLVVTTRVPADALRIGDVVTYINPDNQKQTITHRIVEIVEAQKGDRSYIVKGDANPLPDEPISARSIIGKSSFSVPLIGYGFDFIRKPLGLLLLIYFPALIIVIHELRLLARYYKSQEPYRVPDLIARLRAKTKSKKRIPIVAKLLLLALLLPLAFFVPAWAALQSTATLTGNTISIQQENPGGGEGSVVLQRLKFTCSADNTAELNKIPGLRIYNFDNELSADVSGWYFESSNGTIVTIPANTILANNTSMNFDEAFPEGIKYAGDFLRLFNDDNVQVDGISWGSDTSEFNPALPAVVGDWRYHRSPPINTNESDASDWDVIDGGGCNPGRF